VDLFPDADSWQALDTAATAAGDLEKARVAAQQFKIEEDKAVAGYSRLRQIPERYRAYGIFGLTAVLLISVAGAVGTVWSAIKPFYIAKSLKLRVLNQESTKIGESHPGDPTNFVDS
jgi:hypothetical protein